MDTKDKINFYFNTLYPTIVVLDDGDVGTEMDDEILECVYLPKQEIVEKYDPCGANFVSISKVKKRKITPLSAYQSLEQELEIVKESNLLYRNLFDSIYNSNDEKKSSNRVQGNNNRPSFNNK
jgi:hypothetical protein